MYMYGSQRTEESGPLAELKNITVVAEEKTNSLLVTGPPQSFKTLRDLIKDLDKRTPQVFIEVAIVDVTLDNSTKFGVEWNWTNFGSKTDQTLGTDFGLSKETTGLKYSIIGNDWSALLHMLTLRSDVKVLSTQAINTADNVEAKISIGVEEPYVSSEEETTGGNFRRSVDFKNVSVSLTVTPHVLRALADSTQGDMISMDVLQTINEIIGREEELNAPRVARREAQTSILTPDGKTIVIGGIIKHNKEKSIKGVPILSRIPLVGELFKSRVSRTQSSELMVFITPHVVNNDLTAQKITEETREKLSVKPPETLAGPEEGTGG
jgi:general secretion pathway protein D